VGKRSGVEVVLDVRDLRVLQELGGLILGIKTGLCSSTVPFHILCFLPV
jgi:hypothetical protein